MGTPTRILCTATIALLLALCGCSNTVAISPVYLGVTMSPRPASVPVGTTVVFTGTVSNDLTVPQWSFLDAAAANNLGTLSAVPGSSKSISYTAPATPPIYGATPSGITQGTVTLNVSVTDPPGTSTPTSGDGITFVITAPTVTVSLGPLTASVGLGTTQQFVGYAVGNLNSKLTWQLSAPGAPTNSSALGSIDTTGTYIAPAAMPTTGNTVTVSIIAQADPTRTAIATVTLH